MKIRNQEDEKYFKDITLNNILQEISQESEKDEDYHKALQSVIDNKSQTKFYLQIIFYGMMPILLLLFFFMPLKQLKTKSITKTSEMPSTKARQKKTIAPMGRKEKLPDKKVVPKKIKQTKTLKITPKKKKPTTEAIRENAKEALLKQMKTG